MSHIAFHALSQGKVIVHGAERHHMMVVFDQIGNLMLPEHQREPFSILAMNACLRLRSEVLTLLVRIHGQCEVHCWIEGANRAWIAGLIEQALQCNLFRQGVWWDEVVAFLRANDTEPVFLSYSGASTWPSFHLARQAYQVTEEAWDQLPPAERWKMAEAALRHESAQEVADPDAPMSRELRPLNWHQYLFAEVEPSLN